MSEEFNDNLYNISKNKANSIEIERECQLLKSGLQPEKENQEKTNNSKIIKNDDLVNIQISKEISPIQKIRDISPISQKYKKTNLKAAFGKLLNEKNLIAELRKNFLKSLTKLNDNSTKEIAFSELKDLVNTYCTPEALRIYLSCLSTNYTTCTLAAKEIQAILIGYISSVFKKNLLDSIDKPASILKTVARMCDILFNYMKLNSNVIHNACSYSIRELYKYSMPKEDLNLIILIFVDPILPLVSSGANKLNQIGGAIALGDLIKCFGNENKEILMKCNQKLKTKVENQYLVQALVELINSLDLEYFIFYLKEIYERLINVLNNPKSDYHSRINGLECLKIIAKKLQKIDDEILGYHLTEIIFTLQNACKDRVHKVQLAGMSALKEWREIEEIFFKNKRNYNNKNLSDNEYNVEEKLKKEKEQNINNLKYNKDTDLIQGKMNKLNVLRNLSKLNKHENKNISYSPGIIKEEICKKGIGNVLKISNLLKNFQKEKLTINPNRSKSNPKSFKISPPKNKLIESVENYLKNSKSGNLENSKNLLVNKGKLTDINFYKNKNEKNFEEEFLDYNFLSEGDNENEIIYYNQAMNNVEDYERNKNNNFLSNRSLSEKKIKEDFENLNTINNNILGNFQIYKNKNCENNKNNFAENYKKKNQVESKRFILQEEKNYPLENHKCENYVEKNMQNIKNDLNNLFDKFYDKMKNFDDNIKIKLDLLENRINKNNNKIKIVIKNNKFNDIDENKEKSYKDIVDKNSKINSNNLININISEISKKNDVLLNLKNISNETIEDFKLNQNDNILNKISCAEKNSNRNSSKDKKNLNLNESESNNGKNQKLNEENNNYKKINSENNLKVAQQEELIKNLLEQLDFFKKNQTKINKPNNIEAKTIKIWRDVLYFLELKDFNSAYILLLESEDDLHLLRLLCLTGPVLNNLKLDICKKLIMRINLICRSHQVQKLMLNLIESSNKHFILKFLNKNEQNEILETLYEFSGLNSVIGKNASDLYMKITSNS